MGHFAFFGLRENVDVVWQNKDYMVLPHTDGGSVGTFVSPIKTFGAQIRGKCLQHTPTFLYIVPSFSVKIPYNLFGKSLSHRFCPSRSVCNMTTVAHSNE